MAKRGRKTNDENGAVASRQISLKVTADLFAKIKALSMLGYGGNVNACVVELLIKATDRKDQNFLNALKFYRSNETQMAKFNALAQESTADETPKPPKKKKTSNKKKATAESVADSDVPSEGGEVQ